MFFKFVVLNLMYYVLCASYCFILLFLWLLKTTVFFVVVVSLVYCWAIISPVLQQLGIYRKIMKNMPHIPHIYFLYIYFSYY